MHIKTYTQNRKIKLVAFMREIRNKMAYKEPDDSEELFYYHAVMFQETLLFD